ncbi:hypothetical protein Pmani_030887 [Petrolisthes manimaculis]|uniref:Uncharacterized protein n=1 Tax=Petrolisthes manimaculis TaxID=1843537 RepID=A0AAE1NWV3_9EUCA|nr:hypothetical protein Pmani_030887 [Petrolisthes manimaculis]
MVSVSISARLSSVPSLRPLLLYLYPAHLSPLLPHHLTPPSSSLIISTLPTSSPHPSLLLYHLTTPPSSLITSPLPPSLITSPLPHHLTTPPFSLITSSPHPSLTPPSSPHPFHGLWC